MKRVTIKAWHKGLVFRNGNYVKLLDEGSHWLAPFSEVIEYDLSKPFTPAIHFNVFLADPNFEHHTMVVDVKASELVLRYQNGLFSGVHTMGRYIYWKGLINYEFVTVDLNQTEVDARVDRALLSHKELTPFVRSYTVEPHEKAVMYLDGKLSRVLEPGSYHFWKNSSSILMQRADLRTMQIEIAGQEILTRDKAALRLSFYAQYRIADLMKAVAETKEYDKQLYVLLQLALREAVGGYTLDELLENKESISAQVQRAVADKLDALGVSLSGCGIRDIILPGDMKEILNQVLVAEKKAQANTIMRREETASTRSLLNTAKLMEENAMLFKLKEMEYVEKIAEKINTISLSGGGQLAEQLKQIFSPGK